MKKQAAQHLSGAMHVSGRSHFIADEAPLSDTLYAKFFFSPVAHARIIKLDISQALSYPGVARVLTASDIPGQNVTDTFTKIEPLFPIYEIMYAGQPLAMVLASDDRIAELAADLIKIEYEPLPVILDAEEADALGMWYAPVRTIETGDPEAAFKNCPHILEGKTHSGSQEHLYLETQRSYAIPFEGKRMKIHSATQNTMEIQDSVAHILGIPAHDVIVDVPRLGGAFGGKERAATIWACMAALGAHLTRRPVLVLLTRDEDMHVTGKRHPFTSFWKVGFDDEGRILAYDLELIANGGAYADLSLAIMERAMLHSDNAYYIPNLRVRGRACITHLPPNTAFRGFGAPQGMFVIESIMDRIALCLNIDKLQVRRLNLYPNEVLTHYGQKVCDCSLSQIIDRLEKNTGYQARKAEVAAFNAKNQRFRRGLGIVPVKFGISFTATRLNQGSALVWVYGDGSVSVSTGGVEMGQELYTKVASIVARVLGLDISRIKVESSNTQRVGNASPTAASTGSDINGNAARIAAEKIRSALTEPALTLLKQEYGIEARAEDIVFSEGKVFSCQNPDYRMDFTLLVSLAYDKRIPLGAYGYYRTPKLWFDRELGRGIPFHYFVFAAALAEVEVDSWLGEHTLRDFHIIYETGQSLNTRIDMGQIMGAAIQGYGWCTMEELVHSPMGHNNSANPSTYKIPTIRDLPDCFTVEMIETTSERSSVYGSKGIGEPPLICSLAIFFALQDAMQSLNPEFQLSFPATPEAIIKGGSGKTL